MENISPQSYWHRTNNEPLPARPALAGEQHFDVAIIGGGITGLTAALHLKRAGKRVAVLEAGRCAGGTSGGTTGHLDLLPDQGIRTLIDDFGEAAARQITDARRRAIAQIDQWTREFDIPCDLRGVPGILYTTAPDRVSQLRDEYEAALQIGLSATWRTDVESPLPVAAAIEFSGHARFHSVRYLAHLAKQVEVAGIGSGHGVIFEQTRAEPPEDGAPCRVAAPGGELRADQVILATHSAYLGISQFDMRMAPHQSYVIAARCTAQMPDALYWDDEDPYHYIRRANSDEPDLWIIGGADHKTGQGDAEAHLRSLRHYAVEQFGAHEFTQQWSAEFFEPSDGLPFIGRVPFSKHLYIAAGYSGTGLTYGTMAGQLLTDLVLECDSPLAEIVSPARFKPVAAARDLVVENLNVAKEYVTSRLPADGRLGVDSLAPGQGRTIRYDGQNCAAYRDEQGQVYLLSPVCPHAGCHVQWNNGEKTWDCPCHGSRFSATGERLYGPAANDLGPLNAADEADQEGVVIRG